MICLPHIHVEVGKRPRGCYHQHMIASRALTLALVALANTAVWAGLLYFLTPILGIQLGTQAMAGICAVIFVLSLLILAMGGIAADKDDAGGRDG